MARSAVRVKAVRFETIWPEPSIEAVNSRHQYARRSLGVDTFPPRGSSRREKTVLLSGVVGSKTLDHCIQLFLNSVECVLGISQLFLCLLHPG